MHDRPDCILHIVICRTESRVARIEFTQEPVVVHELESISVFKKDISKTLADPLDQSHMCVIVVSRTDQRCQMVQ